VDIEDETVCVDCGDVVVVVEFDIGQSEVVDSVGNQRHKFKEINNIRKLA
jgi:transcription initiation factor TFIIIB Brf1 subunit/transcription initiation factor TFIIB